MELIDIQYTSKNEPFCWCCDAWCDTPDYSQCKDCDFYKEYKEGKDEH